MEFLYHEAEKELVLFLKGQINSTSAQAVDNEIQAILKKRRFQTLVLDCAELEYITSAGLRDILSLKKKHDSLSLIHVSQEVYNIFDMTGFTALMHIEKALRKISVEGKPIVGEGFTATVYRLSPDSIVKVFKGQRNINDIKAEIDSAKKAFIYGIPTAISYDIVDVGDGRKGLVFEMLDCASLRDLIVEHPENFEKYKKMYADLSYQITHTDASDSGLQTCKEPLLKKFQNLSQVLTAEEFSKLMRMVEEIPDTGTLTHGDFHIKNILVLRDEPLLIDMDAVAIGNPIFELEGIRLSFLGYNAAEPNNASEFFGVSQEVIDALYDALIHRYFPDKKDGDLQRILEKIELLSTAHLAYQTIRYKRDVNGRLEKATKRLKELLARYDDLDLSK